MRRISVIATAFAATLICSVASAQTPQLPRPGQTPVPQMPQPRLGVQTPLRVVPLQSAVPVSQFAAGDLRCAANLQSATILVSAVLTIARDPVRPGPVQVEVLIDGVSIGAESLSVQNGAVRVARRATLAGSQGQHTAVFVVNGLARSTEQAFVHNCVSQTQLQLPAPGQLALPNLAFGDMLLAQVARHGVVDDGGRYAVTAAGFTSDHRRIDDIGNLATPIPFRSTYCAAPSGDAPIAQVAIQIRPLRVADPERYAVHTGSGLSSLRYVDTRTGARFPNGNTATGDPQQGDPLPIGHQWLIVYFPLECTRNALVELRFDPDNHLRESNEDDNVLRFRYSTVP